MTSIAVEISTEASPSAVWDAIRDIGAVHTRLVPGFVVATELVPGGRRVTFGNGKVVVEPIVSPRDRGQPCGVDGRRASRRSGCPNWRHGAKGRHRHEHRAHAARQGGCEFGVVAVLHDHGPLKT